MNLPNHLARSQTIRVRTQKGGKVLHKFTWDGEEFVEQK
jgi:hypothetical protein